MVTNKTPCSQHTLLILSKPYMCACNCLDESKDGKIQEINSEKYNCTTYKGDHSDSKELRYICTECCSSHLSPTKTNNLQNNSDVVSPEHPEDISINAIRAETLNLQFPFSEFLLCGRESGKKFIHFKDISNIFLLLSKVEFSPWDVYLQNGKTGIMLRNFGYQEIHNILPLFIRCTL